MWDTQVPHSGLVVRHGDDHVSFNGEFVSLRELEPFNQR